MPYIDEPLIDKIVDRGARVVAYGSLCLAGVMLLLDPDSFVQHPAFAAGWSRTISGVLAVTSLMCALAVAFARAQFEWILVKLVFGSFMAIAIMVIAVVGFTPLAALMSATSGMIAARAVALGNQRRNARRVYWKG